MPNDNLVNSQAGAEIWETRILGIDGMTCDNCARALTRAIKQLNSVKDIRVDRENARAEITFDTTKTHLPAIHEAILRSGFKPAREIPA